MKKRVVLLLAIAMLAGNVNSVTAFADMAEIGESADIDVTDIDETEKPEISVDIPEEDEDTAEQYEDVENADFSEDTETSDSEEDSQLFSDEAEDNVGEKTLTGMYFTPDQTDLEITPNGGGHWFDGTMIWKYADEDVTEKIEFINGGLFKPGNEWDDLKLVVIDKDGNVLDGSNPYFWLENYNDATYTMYFQYGDVKSNSFVMNIKHKDLSNLPFLTLGDNTVELGKPGAVGYSVTCLWYRFVPEETGIYNFTDGANVESGGFRCVDDNGNPAFYNYYIKPGEQWIGKFAGQQLIKGKTYYIGVATHAEGVDTGTVTIKRVNLDGCQWKIVGDNTLNCLKDTKVSETCLTHKGETRTRVIPAGTEHKWSWVVTRNATALKTGEKKQKCQICGTIGSTQTIAKLPATLNLNVTAKKTIPMQVKQSFSAKAAGLATADGVKSWTSSNKKVATVSSSGKIVAKKAGTATITVTLNSGYTTWFKVKVQKNAVATSSLKVLNKATGKAAAKKVTLKRKEKLNLSAVTAPVTSKQKVTYTSSKKSVATVNSKGVVTAKKKGKATITVKSGKKTVKIQVTVK